MDIPEINIPGISKARARTPHTELPEEIQEMRREIANKVLEEQQRVDTRKLEIIDEVKKRLSNLEPVQITDEMRDLKLDKQVFGMIQSAESTAFLVRHLRADAEDLDYWDQDDPMSWLPRQN